MKNIFAVNTLILLFLINPKQCPAAQILELPKIEKEKIDPSLIIESGEKERTQREASTEAKFRIPTESKSLKNQKETEQPSDSPEQLAIKYNTLGNLYEEKGMYNQAKRAYEKVLTLTPDSAMAYSNLGNVYSKLGQLNKAIAKYKHAIRINPRAAFAHNNLGNAYYAQKNFSKAIKEYKIAIVLDSELFYAYNNLGDAYLRKNLPNLAIRYFKKAIEFDPSSYIAHANMGDAYVAKDYTPEAIKAYKKALGIKPDYSSCLLKLANLYKKEKDIAKAGLYYKNYIKYSNDSKKIELAKKELKKLEKLK